MFSIVKSPLASDGLGRKIGRTVRLAAAVAVCASAPATSQPVPAKGALPAGVVSVPIQTAHGIIFVPAAVSGHHGFFVLDIGSPEVVLNTVYLRRTSPTEFDTVTSATAAAGQNSAQALIPTLTLTIDTVNIPVTTLQNGVFPIAAAAVSLAKHEAFVGRPFLGIIGQNVFAHHEVIIDYAHQRLVLIPVDSSGKRLVSVPQYQGTDTVPIFLGPDFHWYVEARLGGMTDTLLLDTGNDLNELNVKSQPLVAAHVRQTGTSIDVMEEQHKPGLIVDSVSFAGNSYADVLFYGSHSREDCLGNSFFSRHAAVGFNFQSRRMTLYKQ